MIKQIKYEKYIKKKLDKRYQVIRIELLKRLPKKISYLTWSVGESELDKSFRVIVEEGENKEIELYIQIKSILWFIIRSIIWQKSKGIYKRIDLKKIA